MHLRATYPQYEMSDDPSAIRDFAQAVEGMGYSDLAVYEHVLGADRSRHPGFEGPYDHTTTFHEPFVLFGYLAAVTKTIGLTTSILILPQRQTALVAKQAAEVAVLSGGRLRLGIGVGWNSVEYDALGMDFHTRGARSAEQVLLLRELWSKDVVDFDGQWDTVVAAGIKPRPKTSIAIWVGGNDDRVLRRASTLGDGWFPESGWAEGVPLVERLRRYLAEAGREPASFGIEGSVSFAQTTPADQQAAFEAWRKVGVSSMSVGTLGSGFTTVDEHLEALRSFIAEYGSA